MATLALDTPPSTPSQKRRPKRWARRCERYCCLAATHFPLVFVYGLSSWAVWVQASIGLVAYSSWTGRSLMLSTTRH